MLCHVCLWNQSIKYINIIVGHYCIRELFPCLGIGIGIIQTPTRQLPVKAQISLHWYLPGWRLNMRNSYLTVVIMSIMICNNVNYDAIMAIIATVEYE